MPVWSPRRPGRLRDLNGLAGLMLACMLWMTPQAHAQERKATPARAGSPQCWVADFREMALTTHAVGERERKALDWLKRHAAACTDAQLLAVASNRPAWLGHADTVRVASAMDRELERRYVTASASVGGLFDSPAPKPASTEAVSTPPAPAAVVPAAPPASATPAAVVVQQPPAGSNSGN